MTKKLHRQIVWMTMGVLVLLVVLIDFAAQCGMRHACGQMTSQIILNLAENTEGIQSNMQICLKDPGMSTTVLTVSKEELMSIINIPLYGVELLPDGQVRAFSNLDGEPSGIGETEAAELLVQIQQADTGAGKAGAFRYYKAKKPYGYYAVITDSGRGLEREVSRHVGKIMIAISAPILLALFFLSMVLAHFVVRPTVAAFQKQKQFISDAGHELKTPLSAISVNAAVLETEIGSNKYMDCIQAEARRMDGLVRQLLEVACLEGEGIIRETVRFSLSDVVYQATLPFESLAFEQNIRYTSGIQEDCFYTGEPERIRQVMSILLDNAFKYGREGGEVSVRLRRDGRRAVIEVYNTGDGISKEDIPHIFERFYRCDKARPGNGSYGLGLAIAQSIVQAHKGIISVESEEHAWTRFRVVL